MVIGRKRQKRKREEQLAKAAAQIAAHQGRMEEVSMPEKKREGRPLGVDIGTSKIVIAEQDSGKTSYSSQLNAFITVDYSRFTQGILQQNKIHHYRDGESLVLYGEGAEVFANMLNAETRRPMRHGMLNPAEGSAIRIVTGILNDIVPESKSQGYPLCFSVPGKPCEGTESDLVYHEAILRRFLSEKGYTAKGINEGLAVVFSELEAENFTGLGISAGGGMCNVCLAFLSVPLLSFSIKKAGDYIDDAVASVTGEVNTRVRKIKENQFSLSRKPRNEVEDALNIFYDDLILTLVNAIWESVTQNSKLPKFDRPIPIVLSGGTAMVDGFRERFKTVLEGKALPFEIDQVRLANEPLYATAKGALIASMYED